MADENIGLSDYILKMDRQQSVTQADADASLLRYDTWKLDKEKGVFGPEPKILEAGKYCPKDRKHGLLAVHGTGQLLACGACGYAISIARSDVL